MSSPKATHLKQLIKEAIEIQKSCSPSMKKNKLDNLLEEISIYHEELVSQNNELERLRASLAESEKKYSDLFLEAPISYILIDPDFRMIEINNTFKRLVDASSNELIGQKITRFIHPDNQDDFHLFLQRILKDTSTQSIEVQIKGKTENTFVLAQSGPTSLHSSPKTKNIRLSLTNISLRKEQEDEEKLSHVTENMLEVFWLRDADNRKMLYINEAYETIWGRSRESLYEKPNSFFETIVEEDKARVLKAFKDYSKTQKFKEDYRIQKPSGEIRWVHARAFPVKDKKGNIIRHTGFAMDITVRKNIEFDLIREKNKAEEASKAKSEFLANMSHEIRTPMNSILGFSEIMLEDSTNQTQKDHLKIIIKSGNSLLSLIDDILDLSKVEAGKLEMRTGPADLRVLIHELIQIFQNTVQQKNIQLITEIDDSLPRIIMTDEMRLRQVLLNLIGNAVKFTSEGMVRIKIIVSNRRQGSLDLEIAVSDTGIGIPEKEKERIFDSFSQQSGQDSRKYGGTGLGLAISKRMCELMNGKIEVESTPGKGSEFRLIFPGITVPDKSSSFAEKSTVMPVAESHHPAGNKYKSDELGPSIREEFQKMIAPEISQLTDMIIIEDLYELTQKLDSFAGKHQISALKKLNENLKKHLKDFDVEKIQETLTSANRIFMD